MGTWIMAGVTFREAARKKVLWMALAAGFAFLTLFGVGLHFQTAALAKQRPFVRQQAANGMLLMGLYAVDLLAVVMTVLASVDTLSGEIASGAIQAVATKPVSRFAVLLGKWLGFVAMLAAYIILMMGGISLLARWISGATLNHWLPGFGLIVFESALLLNLTFLFGATCSTLTNGVLVFGLHGIAFLGGWIEQAGAVTHSPRAVDVGIIASLIMPSESLWRRAAFEMQSPLLGSFGMSPFSNASVPSGDMILYAAIFSAIAFFLASYYFRHRDL